MTTTVSIDQIKSSRSFCDRSNEPHNYVQVGFDVGQEELIENSQTFSDPTIIHLFYCTKCFNCQHLTMHLVK